jgi:AbrB family looped-hinge helix DNA binding protein
MVRARITSKGQITLPVEVRRRYRLQVGDEIAFRMDDAGPRILPLRRRPIAELRGMFSASRSYPGKEAVRREIGRMLGEELNRKVRRARRQTRSA